MPEQQINTSGPNPPAGQGTYYADWPASALLVSGNDRLKFLQNLCTADVLRLESGGEAFFTNVKGHVLAHTWLALSEEAVEVVVFQRDANPLAEHLDRYLIREDVQITVTAPPALVVLGHRQREELLARAEVRLTPFGLLGPEAWLLRQTDGTVPAPEQLARWQLVEGSRDTLEALRIEAGWPLAGIDFGDRTLPQELARDASAISFTKGCYLGQETVARLDALGHVNKQLRVVQLPADGALSLPADLTAGDRPVGQVTSVAAGPSRQARLGLAIVRRGSESPGTRLMTPVGEAVVLDRLQPG